MYRKRFPILWILTLTVLLLTLLATIFEVDQAVRAQGQIISGARTQVIQAVDGGMLTALHVKEGDVVKRGQVLADLERDRAAAGVAQVEAEVASKQIALIRAKAEVSGQTPIYGPEFSSHSQFVNVQLGIYQQRKQSLDEELGVLTHTMLLAQEELSMVQRLYQHGDISQSEIIRAKRQVLDLQQKIQGVKNKYRQETRTELAKLEDELTISLHKRNERLSILKHTLIASPVNGIVKLIRINTVGGVLKPGDELLQISPLNDDLLVEIKVNPADVGLLKTGLPVTLRFDAFDSSIYGTLSGHLLYISPDTLSEQASNGQTLTYYRAQIAIDWSAIPKHGNQSIKPADIKLGLTATADVLTGKRSILGYLMKPISLAFSGALAQR